MEVRDRWNNAVGWVVNHFALAAFVWAAGGAVLAVRTASMSVLSAYAPFSYVIAAFVGAILATASLWSLWAFGRWLRHGTVGRVPVAVPSGHGSSADGDMEQPPSPGSQSGQVGVSYDAPDIIEAKLRLCSFVMESLRPAIESCRGLISATALALQYTDDKSVQASYANAGVQRYSPSLPAVEVFADRQTVRTSSLVDVERKTVSLLNGYVAAVNVSNTIVAKTEGQIKNSFTRRNLANAVTEWLPKHKALLLVLEKIAADVYFPRIKAEWGTGAYRSDKYPVQVFDDFLTASAQSAS